jgi:hypothetical protein
MLPCGVLMFPVIVRAWGVNPANTPEPTPITTMFLSGPRKEPGVLSVKTRTWTRPVAANLGPLTTVLRSAKANCPTPFWETLIVCPRPATSWMSMRYWLIFGSS